MMIGIAPTMAEERQAYKAGFAAVAGLDEVGRGSLAGPVAAAAVILPPKARFRWLKKVRDSKLLTAKQREELVPLIYQGCLDACVGQASVEEIESNGIVKASRMAMMRALDGLSSQPDFLLVDGMKLPLVAISQKGIVRGDKLCTSIACASIIAKVQRDHAMQELDAVYPGYGFANHKGYGTEEHLEALRRLGPSAIHRRSFQPVSEVLFGLEQPPRT
ncbi:MAG: ribonuclease HII [Chloroflexi bacterium]|nr:ribonuclease HII [Chloroflexota bacterium]